MPPLVELAGRRFGRLSILRRADTVLTSSGQPRTCWEALCDCGNTVMVRAAQLQQGRTRSCGCLHRERAVEMGSANRQEVVGYKHAHRRLSLTKGRASDQECIDRCGRDGADWSYARDCADELVSDGGLTYCLHPEHYVARCRPCHRRHDAQSQAVAS